MSYSVTLDAFQGPLDLLLELISRDRLDAAEISISTITDEYLTAVAQLEEPDLNVASSFLILAATLMELKSLKLLPKKPADPELLALLEEKDHLIHRLIEYSSFKAAAEVLRSLMVQNRDFFYRKVSFPKELRTPGPELLDGLAPSRLAEVAARALQPKPKPTLDTSHITPAVITVGEMVLQLSERIAGAGRETFRKLCAEARSRLEVVVGFLALLEMFKEQWIELDQESPFEDIVVTWRR
ncbi:MAG: segregation and condensation protein A [Actinomycetota bacterium]